MASFRSLRTGLETALQTISGLRVYDFGVDSPATPAAIVLPGSPVVRYNRTLNGADDWQLIIRVLLGAATDRTPTELLDAYLADSGSSSILAAVAADKTLGGACHYAHVTGADRWGQYTYGQVPLLGVEFDVEVATG